MNPETPTPNENLLGSRILAGVIDVVVIAVIFVLFTILLGDTQNGANGDGSSGTSFNLSGLPFIAFILAAMAYYILTEGLWGQTLGKKLARIRVVAVSGDLTWPKVIIRTLLRLIDGLPLLYLLGVLIIAISKNHQRLGDMAAGTRVVRTNPRADVSP